MQRRKLPEEMGIIVIWVIVLLILSALAPRFRTYSNFRVLMLNGSVIAFLALGQAFVLLTGGIDLSAGSVIAMTVVFTSLFMSWGISWPFATLLSLLCGVALGTINGLIIQYVKVPPFIVTFSTSGIATSIPQILTGAESITVADPRFAVIGAGRILSVPIPVLMFIFAAVIAHLVLKRTRFGVHVYAVGGNMESARLAGVNVAITQVAVYAISGLCAAFGGIITVSRLMVGYPSAGTGNELFYSIASAVVGGVSLSGGKGSIIGAMSGAMMIATVTNGMTLLRVPSFWQPLVIGIIILLGVSLDTYRRNISLSLLLRGTLTKIKGGERKLLPSSSSDQSEK